ncbi:porin [Chitinibacter fontanus]|uniref:Porin n=1 Tax=Chitinibacter fontanus TaxID=1737446 RepID=A0A7D5V8F5_9NEIS|nr:porin [Chitinibacter fontanus]QLI80691.1 porin [Chitinibacter fontanus]
MNKFVAAAVAAAFVAPAVMADVDLGPVKIYGSLRSAVEVVSVDAFPGTTLQDGQDSQTRVADQSSRIGVKGDWKISDDLKAIGQVESRFYLGNNGDPLDGSKIGFGTRNTFIGLDSAKAGKFLIGRYDNAYKNLKKSAYGVFDGTLNDASEFVGDKSVLARLGGRQGDMVHYETPNWAGFNGQLSYNFGKVATTATTTYTTKCATVSNCTTTAATTGGEKINAPQFSAALAYNHEYFDIGVGYSKVEDAASDLKGGKLSIKSDATGKQGDESMDAFTVGATAKFAGAKLSAVWEKTNAKANNTVEKKVFDQEQVSYGIGASYAFGDWDFQTSYAVAKNVEEAGKEQADTGGKEFGIAASYKLHKQVRVIASYTKIDNDKNTAFTSSSGFDLAKGSDASIIAIGLRGDF